MTTKMATAISLLLLPFAVYFYRVLARCVVELMYMAAPEGKFKELLARDRASRR